MEEPKRYWLAHVRGPFYEKLRQLGFLVFYPAMDDYVFLEACDANKKLLNKQTELCIYFLKKREKLLTVSAAEVEVMAQTTIEQVTEASDIEVVSGYAAGLSGTIQERDGDRLRCVLQGFNRQYDVWVDRLDVVYREVTKDQPDPNDEHTGGGRIDLDLRELRVGGTPGDQQGRTHGVEIRFPTSDQSTPERGTSRESVHML